MTTQRWILHLDMDAFFASVEQRDDPTLRGKPVLVGHDGSRGVVAAASYEARRFGCHSAQPMVVAKRRCPQAIIRPVRGERYRALSAQLFDLLDEYAPLVEPLSIDEAFLDLTGTERTLGSPMAVAQRLKARIVDALALRASVGLAPNKYLAKLASDMDKPDGLTVIEPGEITRVLGPLPVSRIWGVGRVRAEKLAAQGIRTIGDLQALSMEALSQTFGNEAEQFWRLARGIDDRPVVPDRQAKSMGQEQTFGQDLTDPMEVKRVLLSQVEQVARRLRKHGVLARGIAIKVRFGDFETITRSATLDRPTDITTELWRAARDLFDRWPFRPVRLIGAAAERLTREPPQGELFVDAQRDRQQRLDQVADTINHRFGKSAIRRGGA